MVLLLFTFNRVVLVIMLVLNSVISSIITSLSIIEVKCVFVVQILDLILVGGGVGYLLLQIYFRILPHILVGVRCTTVIIIEIFVGE